VAVVAPALVRRLGSARALLVCKAGTVPVALLIPLAGRGWGLVPFVVGTVVPVAGIVAGNVVSGGFFQRYVPRGLMGRVSTAMQVVNFGTIPIGALLGGLLADRLGYRPALWLLLGGLLAATGILLGGPLRGRRDLPTRPPEAS
jgi:predicted MFS family arabinose efflux permease